MIRAGQGGITVGKARQMIQLFSQWIEIRKKLENFKEL